MKTFGSYFWIISIAFILLSSMPCYAQVETQGFFLPNHTAWYIDNGLNDLSISDPHLLFQNGKLFLCGSDMYSCYEAEDDPFGNSLYQNRLISKFAGTFSIYNSTGPVPVYYTFFGHVISCLGFGRTTYYVTSDWPPIGGDRFESTLIRDYTFFVK